MGKDKLLVVNVGGENRAIIPVINADLDICQLCGYCNGGICLRKHKIIEKSVGRNLVIYRNCKIK